MKIQVCTTSRHPSPEAVVTACQAMRDTRVGHTERKKFVLIGAAGYIAPRHMKAIKDTGNELVAALDKSDAVGVMDSYFPDAEFFTEFERFDRHIEKLQHEQGQRVHYVSICSPNYLHDAHIRFALRIGADAICEKPVVLNPWNLDALERVSHETGRNVNVILQLRLHPAIRQLKQYSETLAKGRRADIDLTYITARGRWYMTSWKGDISKSGGVTTNIGIHFFDMLRWIFGKVEDNVVYLSEPTRAAGMLELEKARVRWFLSVDQKDLPYTPAPGTSQTWRAITVDGRELAFSSGFEDLHTQSYRTILEGNGFSLEDARAAIEIVSQIRSAEPVAPRGQCHPMLRNCVHRLHTGQPLWAVGLSDDLARSGGMLGTAKV